MQKRDLAALKSDIAAARAEAAKAAQEAHSADVPRSAQNVFQPNQFLTYSGPFTNTTFNAKGTVVIKLTISTDNVVSGFIKFTQSPGERTICGAGNFAGTKQKKSIEFTFLDPDCVRGSGMHFTVTGTLSEDDRIFEGNYSSDDGQHGIFRVSKTTGNDTTNYQP